ncbi:PREDICTED: sugar transporter ERD6-like 6 [Papilio xuthus]|uniref:Sugar transporter ERD6-like 6 n=1 Tax=Papilio xuthus TaxID=66420 RepID=A0AAJ6ZYI6_PAPXU|nr:PREDICTED: sugar transporter ERD6-like 6 [Papilio xuthus]
MHRSRTVRQLFILSGLTICGLSDGFIFGQMSGMVDALRGKEIGISLNDSDISWIASTVNATCIFGFVLAGIVTEKVGRRGAIAVLSVPMILTWIMLYFATSFTIFVASRIIVGISYGGVILLTYITTAEYTTAKQRAMCLTIVTAVGPSIGTALGHVLSILMHWRTVALMGIIPTTLSAVLPFFWVESPSWLASKGRFEESMAAYRELHGRSESTELELKLLVNFEKIKQNEFTPNKKLYFSMLEKIILALKQAYFWKISLLVIVITVYRVAGGRILYNTLAITMLHEMTGNSNILMSTLLVDGFIVTGSIIPVFLFRKMKTRTILFLFGLTSNIVLIVLSACLYYIPKENMYYAWVCSLLLAFYFIIAYSGPYAVLEILLSELYPLELKSFCTFLYGSFAGFETFLSVKLAPSMFVSMGYHGVFLLNASIVFLCLGYLWYYLPETKGRSLQEIELYFRNGKFDNDLILEQCESDDLVA